jgi:hypothetical protein
MYISFKACHRNVGQQLQKEVSKANLQQIIKSIYTLLFQEDAML